MKAAPRKRRRSRRHESALAFAERDPRFARLPGAACWAWLMLARARQRRPRQGAFIGPLPEVSASLSIPLMELADALHALLLASLIRQRRAGGFVLTNWEGARRQVPRKPPTPWAVTPRSPNPGEIR